MLIAGASQRSMAPICGPFGACAPPGSAPPGPPLPPPPKPKYTRFTDPDLQDLYARIVAVMKSVPLMGDEVADQVATQMVNAVRGLPQSRAILETASCAALNFARVNWYWMLFALGAIGGTAALGAWLVVRKR